MNTRKNLINAATNINKNFSFSNFKTKKILVGFTLLVLMVAPMLFAIGVVSAQGATSGTFSLVVSGTGSTTNITSISLPTSPNPIGTTLNFDIYISNANDIWGWTIPTVTWNPVVLQLTSVKEGPYLADNTGVDPTSFAGSSKALWDNTNGDISGGLSEVISAADQSIAPSGVVATLTFTVSGYGNSALIINGGYVVATPAPGSPKIPSACNSASVEVSPSGTSINLYQSGSTTNAHIQFPSLQNPIGASFKVDMYITGATSVWEWNASVTWDPNVIQLQTITEGSYLSQSGATIFKPGFIDNYLGKVDSGISDAYTSSMSATAISGVLATLTFKIITYGNSNLNITTGSPSTLLNQNTPHQAIPINALNNATYTWTPAPATGPQAIVTTIGSPFGADSNQTLTNYALTLDGSQSAAGINMVPPYQNCPITAYSWSVTLVNGTVLTSNAATLNLTAAQVGSASGTIVATLTVIAPSPTNTPAPVYIPIGTTQFTIQVLLFNNWTNGMLDIWTQNGGQGINANATSFGPQQQVDLTAQATYNGAPVVDKTVNFDVYINGSYINVVTAQTNLTGFATTSYIFPWQDSDPTAYFGVVTVTGAVDLSQVTLNDTCQFYYGYQLNLQSVQITNGVYDVNGVGPGFFRNYAGLNVVTLTATVKSTNWAATPFYLTATVFDNETVPVACTVTSESGPAALPGTTATSSTTQTYTISLNIPTWAFVGPASVCVNILNALPAQNGLAFSPQQSASLYIYNGT